MKTPPLVYAIVLVYNNYHDTEACLKSLQGCDYPNLKIVVVDNASSDNCAIRLRNAFPDIFVFKNICNLGFAVGNNVGIQFAQEQHADYVLLVNNDTIATPQAISRLVEVAKSDERIAAVAPKILDLNNPRTISFAGGRLSLWRCRTKHIGQGELDEGQYRRTQECDYLTGAFLLVKYSAIEKIGLLPDVYFMYWEDVDWSMTMRRAGYKLCVVPEAEIYHKISTTTRKLPYMSISMEHKGAKIFIRRWLKGARKITAYIFCYIYFLRRICYMVRSHL